MKKEIILILILSISAWPIEKVCKTDTLKIIQSKAISEMSDGEYRIFDECLKKCRKCDPCKDKYILEMKDKSINQMNNNEYDYFSDHFWDCGSIKPCSLKQFIELKDKKEIEMTNNEYDFFKKCKDECISYQEHPSHKSQIWIVVLLALGGILLLGVGVHFIYRPVY
jgi:hypothetical protein